MANESLSVSGPVKVVSDTKERVAYDLMQVIAFADGEPQTKSREYYLTLYRQCWKAANGDPLELILKKT